MTFREVVNMSTLNGHLTKELEADPRFVGSKLCVRYRLSEPGADGCNWSSDPLFINCSVIDSNVVTSVVNRIMEEGRKRFNLDG